MTYDAVIIGAGPGGYECALHISKLGGKAAIVEKGELGGVCTNRGCIPTKALAAGCETLDVVQRASEFGVEATQQRVDVQALFKRRDRVSMTLRKGVEKLLSDAKVALVRGEARVKSAAEVEAGGKTLSARAIVIATGSKPVGLPGIDLDGKYVISGDDAATLTELPKRIVIIGGGFIGCEYASIYSRLGCDVTLVEAMPRILSTEDLDISKAIAESLAKNVRILVDAPVKSVDKSRKAVYAAAQELPADLVLMAVGRRPVLPEGLEALGVVAERSGIKVDRSMRTSVDGVFAVGDAASGLKLAHVAYHGAEVAAGNIMGRPREADFSAIPWCVFTRPEIARVGLAEADVKAPVRVGRAEYLGNGKARCMGEREGFCKVVVDEKTGILLGVHIFGAHASDLIGEAALAVRLRLKAADIAGTIHPHPTLTELLKKACDDACG